MSDRHVWCLWMLFSCGAFVAGILARHLGTPATVALASVGLLATFGRVLLIDARESRREIDRLGGHR